MISKELLSEVLKNEYMVEDVSKGDFRNNITMYYQSIDGSGNVDIFKTQLNIYELAHKCKEWAHRNGYEIETDYTGLAKVYTAGSTYPILPTPFRDNSIHEPEAIFKACQWILDNKEKE